MKRGTRKQLAVVSTTTNLVFWWLHSTLGDAGDAADYCRLLQAARSPVHDAGQLVSVPPHLDRYRDMAAGHYNMALSRLYTVTTHCSPLAAASLLLHLLRLGMLGAVAPKEPRPKRQGPDRLAASSWPCRQSINPSAVTYPVNPCRQPPARPVASFAVVRIATPQASRPFVVGAGMSLPPERTHASGWWLAQPKLSAGRVKLELPTSTSGPLLCGPVLLPA